MYYCCVTVLYSLQFDKFLYPFVASFVDLETVIITLVCKNAYKSPSFCFPSQKTNKHIQKTTKIDIPPIPRFTKKGDCRSLDHWLLP